MTMISLDQRSYTLARRPYTRLQEAFCVVSYLRGPEGASNNGIISLRHSPPDYALCYPQLLCTQIQLHLLPTNVVLTSVCTFHLYPWTREYFQCHCRLCQCCLSCSVINSKRVIFTRSLPLPTFNCRGRKDEYSPHRVLQPKPTPGKVQDNKWSSLCRVVNRKVTSKYNTAVQH